MQNAEIKHTNTRLKKKKNFFSDYYIVLLHCMKYIILCILYTYIVYANIYCLGVNRIKNTNR